MSWEFTLLDALQCIHTPVLDKLMVGVTFLGDAGWFWIALGVLLLFTKKYRKTGILILTALCFSALFANLMLKPLVARERPCWINESVHLLVAMPKDYSFPSGHTQASFASATAIFHVNKKRRSLCIYSGSFDCIFKTVFICTFSDRCVSRDWNWSNLWTACRRGISRGVEEKN